MRAIPNTVRREGVYHFRIAVPRPLRHQIGRAEIMCSLRTSDPRQARHLSRMLYVRSGELFDRIMTTHKLTDGDIQAMVRDFYRSWIDGDDAARWLDGRAIPEPERQQAVQAYRRRSAETRRALASNDYGAMQMVSMALVDENLGRDREISPVDRRRLMQALMRAGIDVADTMAARLEGDFNHQPRDALLKLALDQAPPAHTSTPSCAAAPVFARGSQGKENGPLFSTYAEAFRLAQHRRKKWENQTAQQARKTFELLVDVCGDRALGGYDRHDAYQLKEALEDLPADYGKAAKYKGMAVQAIIEAAADPGIQRLSVRTVQRHFHALSTLWDHAIAEGHAANNIFHGWKFGSSKRARDQRAMWESADLEKLFTSPIWTGCKSSARRSKPGSDIIRDERFWLPLIAVFSGMRQEEICQLRPADVVEVEGIWIFDINDRDGKQLKNDTARRRVPVHSKLIDIGWLDYCDAQRRAGFALLFPNLRPGGADDRLGHNYSKWFTRYRRDAGVYQAGRDFHSFRHSATTFLKRAGVEESVIDELTGHVTLGETARYSKGLTIANLKNAIDRLDIGVDLGRLGEGASKEK